MTAYQIIKHFFSKYGRLITDENLKFKTFGMIISKSSPNQELNDIIHTKVGFIAKNATVILSLLNDFIKADNFILLDGIPYKVLMCEEHKYLNKPLYMRILASKIQVQEGIYDNH